MWKTLIAYATDCFAPSSKKILLKVQYSLMATIFVAALAAISVAVSEICLAYAGFKYLRETLNYSESVTLLCICGTFFLQALIMFLALVSKLGKAVELGLEEQKEQNEVQKITAAFVEGFKSAG